jgi:hypothetical protein
VLVLLSLVACRGQSGSGHWALAREPDLNDAVAMTGVFLTIGIAVFAVVFLLRRSK